MWIVDVIYYFLEYLGFVNKEKNRTDKPKTREKDDQPYQR